MIRQEQLNRMRDLAQRIVERCAIGETRFSEHASFNDFQRDVVTALTEGRLGGQLFAVWLPIAGEMYRQEALRSRVISRAREAWRIHAFSHILKPSMLIGPKGKLPA